VAWTGSELLVWGGFDGTWSGGPGTYADGAAFDARSGSWRMLPEAPISAREPLSVWTGRELIVWGTAIRVKERPRDGAAYDPKANSWRRIADAPIELTDATAVWTGREMIVFGAALHGGNFPETDSAVGAAYDPRTDTWRRIPDSELSPQASTAAWDGREMVAWDYENATAAYDPDADRWRQLPDVPLDDSECTTDSVGVGHSIFGNYCGRFVVFDRSDQAWEDVTRRQRLDSRAEVVAAGPTALVLANDYAHKDGERSMFAYRP